MGGVERADELGVVHLARPRDAEPLGDAAQLVDAVLLGRGDSERLELVRRSLYLKVNKKLSGLGRARSTGWQRRLLARLVKEWGWDERQLALLDSRNQWKVRQVAVERRELVAELNHSYRFLSQFARAENASSRADRRDLNVLGRRLYAAFERRAGKIEVINPGIAPDLAEALFEQGAARAETGDTSGAADAWLTLIDKHPDSNLAGLARFNLQRLP